MQDSVEEVELESGSEPERGVQRGLSRWGHAGLALLLIHVTLLFFPPMPPDMKGSFWDWLTGYAAVALLLIAVGRQRRRLAAHWSELAPRARWRRGLGAALAMLLLAITLRVASPPLYVRFSAEAGLWEPVTLFCYLAAAVLLGGMSGELAGPLRKHWRFLTGLYVLMGLEEVDYFGVFGGMIGRIEGVYVGSLHDLILLAVDGLLSAGAWAAIAAISAAVLVGLWWLGYLQPRALLRLAASRDFLWIVVGLGFLLAAAAVEADVLEWASREPTFEEAIEMAGGICFFFFALQVAATRGRPHAEISGAAI